MPQGGLLGFGRQALRLFVFPVGAQPTSEGASNGLGGCVISKGGVFRLGVVTWFRFHPDIFQVEFACKVAFSRYVGRPNCLLFQRGAQPTSEGTSDGMGSRPG